MSIRPTFFGFEVARSGLSSSQRKIDVTGQNIANMNTLGYSRQRVAVSAIGAGGMDWRYAISPSQNVGMGVNIDSIRRVRDEFLDIRFRTEHSHNERLSVKSDVLASIENLLDEFVTDNVYALLGDFMNALQNLHMESDEQEFASMMRSTALKLTSTLNTIAHDMNGVIEMQLMQMELVATMVNRIARELDEVNREIRVQHMINPLIVSNELLDKRDTLLDELSRFGEVTVLHDRKVMPDGSEIATGGIWVYFGSVNVEDINHDDFAHPNLLVVGDRRGHRTINLGPIGPGDPEFPRTHWLDEQGLYRLSPQDHHPGPVRFQWGEGVGISIDELGLGAGDDFFTRSGQIFGYYEMMNGRGDVAAYGDELDQATKGIPYFVAILNSFAQVFANTFNMLNDEGFIEDEYGMRMPGPRLFDAAGDPGGDIDIFNITISEDWQRNPMAIARSMSTSDTPGASRNDNILRMIDALRREDTFFDLEETGGSGAMSGSFSQFIGMLNSEISLEIDYNNSRLTMSDVVLMSIDQMRESIKGVSEDEEAMNLVRFQRSYQAAARLMTTLDEMLELIIMRMGIVGRS